MFATAPYSVGPPTASDLISLEATPADMSPSFESMHYEYWLDVPGTVDVVSVVFVLQNNAAASVFGRGKGMTACFHWSNKAPARAIIHDSSSRAEPAKFPTSWLEPGLVLQYEFLRYGTLLTAVSMFSKRFS